MGIGMGDLPGGLNTCPGQWHRTPLVRTKIPNPTWALGRILPDLPFCIVEGQKMEWIAWTQNALLHKSFTHTKLKLACSDTKIYSHAD